jgi:hypothetical protein
MAGAQRRKCKCCHKLFRPDPRNRHHQRYCAAPRCRAASKAASQARRLLEVALGAARRAPDGLGSRSDAHQLLADLHQTASVTRGICNLEHNSTKNSVKRSR